MLTASLLYNLAGTMPLWLEGMWTQLSFLRAQLRNDYNRSVENQIKRLIGTHAPDYSSDLLQVNLDAECLHMEFLREAISTGDTVWFERAMQLGRRHATFPLFFVWDALSSHLRKYVLYCFLHHDPDRPTLPLLPCPRLRYVDYLEWLPHNGIDSGWRSIRHFAGQLRTWSMVCGYGSIVDDYDSVGFGVWQDNFAANVKIVKAPRGGDIPLRPWHLRRLALVYSSDSPFDKMMLATASLMWFTALRAGHFSPSSLSANDMKHMLEWAFIEPYMAAFCRAQRAALHFLIPTAKPRQAEESSAWSTATVCICEGVDCTSEEHRHLRLLCPVCALERWRRAAPAGCKYVCCVPSTGEPMLREAFNAELRRALDIALDYLDDDVRGHIVKQLSAKSWRSGAATAVVTAGNAGFIAAAFLGHGDTKTTKQFYHKSGDDERRQLAAPLAAGLLPAGEAA